MRFLTKVYGSISDKVLVKSDNRHFTFMTVVKSGRFQPRSNPK